jgi:hypothetical protein
LTLSFGHTHGIEVAEPFGTWRQFTLADRVSSVVISDAPTLPMTPAGPTFDYCEICAATSLAGNGVLPIGPQLCPPTGIGRIQFCLEVDAASAASLRYPFQARAPPPA